MVGSLLDHIPPDYAGVIAGTGKLHAESKVSFPKAKILALRGPLTAKGVKGRFILADPGLLADELAPPTSKLYDIGVVPHWSDHILEKNPLFLTSRTKIIRVSDDPIKVITEISQCRKIVSSSLHGIILADAFGIPRRLEVAPNLKYEGGMFKFKDYSLSIRMKFATGVLQEADRNVIAEKQFALFDMFEEIRRIFS
jgi:pyruvyltransferase